MAGSLNKVQLIGALGRDPDVRTFQNGGKVCNLSLATSESWKDKDSGERKERTEWHKITIHADGLIKVAEQYLKKGSRVYVDGQLETRKWQDQSGNDRYSTEVVLRAYAGTLILLDRKEDGGGSRRRDDEDGGSRVGSRNTAPSTSDLDEDDVPF